MDVLKIYTPLKLIIPYGLDAVDLYVKHAAVIMMMVPVFFCWGGLTVNVFKVGGLESKTSS